MLIPLRVLGLLGNHDMQSIYLMSHINFSLYSYIFQTCFSLYSEAELVELELMYKKNKYAKNYLYMETSGKL